MSTSEILVEISFRVQKAITEAGRSKKSVSDETGIPYPTLNRKVAGKGEFSFLEPFKIAKALGVSPAAFTPAPFRIQRKESA